MLSSIKSNSVELITEKEMEYPAKPKIIMDNIVKNMPKLKGIRPMATNPITNLANFNRRVVDIIKKGSVSTYFIKFHEPRDFEFPGVLKGMLTNAKTLCYNNVAFHEQLNLLTEISLTNLDYLKIESGTVKIEDQTNYLVALNELFKKSATLPNFKHICLEFFQFKKDMPISH
uniref:Reverse transcriptase domain-containing protein n=1 Tax=Rhabditophanes sp. KR3021 TaxID=114890 RepID=A0AC35UF42_9BILA